MRGEDRGIKAPEDLARSPLPLAPSAPGVKFDVEDTGYGWKQEGKVEARDAVPEMKCSMQRP
jgi:hypothetical protein